MIVTFPKAPPHILTFCLQTYTIVIFAIWMWHKNLLRRRHHNISPATKSPNNDFNTTEQPEDQTHTRNFADTHTYYYVSSSLYSCVLYNLYINTIYTSIQSIHLYINTTYTSIWRIRQYNHLYIQSTAFFVWCVWVCVWRLMTLTPWHTHRVKYIMKEYLTY